MVKSIVGKAWSLILEGKTADIPKEFVHYDATDKGWMFTQYDSNIATDWKRGAGVLPLNQVIARPTLVIKDKVKIPENNALLPPVESFS